MVSQARHGCRSAMTLARRLAKHTGGRPAANWGEIFGMPLTAHFLGGCAIGASAREGVVDPWHRVYSYPGLHVVDGSAIPANPGPTRRSPSPLSRSGFFPIGPTKVAPTRGRRLVRPAWCRRYRWSSACRPWCRLARRASSA